MICVPAPRAARCRTRQLPAHGLQVADGERALHGLGERPAGRVAVDRPQVLATCGVAEDLESFAVPSLCTEHSAACGIVHEQVLASSLRGEICQALDELSRLGDLPSPHMNPRAEEEFGSEHRIGDLNIGGLEVVGDNRDGCIPATEIDQHRELPDDEHDLLAALPHQPCERDSLVRMYRRTTRIRRLQISGNVVVGAQRGDVVV